MGGNKPGGYGETSLEAMEKWRKQAWQVWQIDVASDVSEHDIFFEHESHELNEFL